MVDKNERGVFLERVYCIHYMSVPHRTSFTAGEVCAECDKLGYYEALLPPFQLCTTVV